MTEEISTTRTDRAGSASARRKRSTLLFLRDVLVIFVVAVLVSFLIKTFLVRSFFIPSQSMEQTLRDGRPHHREPARTRGRRRSNAATSSSSRIRADGSRPAPRPASRRSSPRSTGSLAFVGLSAPDCNDHLVKRVIGLPGDHVVCCNALGQMSVNGVPLDEPYVALPPGETKVSRDDFDVSRARRLALGHGRQPLQLEGLPLQRARRRVKGFVPIDNVVGRAFVVSWPIDHWAWLDNYPEVFEGVDEGSG